MSVDTNKARTADDCFVAALRRIKDQPGAWKAFSGIFEFVLTSRTTGESTARHFSFENGDVSLENGPAPVMPSARVTIDEHDLVLLARGIIDEELAHRRGLLAVEGDMYVVHKLPSLMVTDMPLYQFPEDD